ncbi:MAG TPA: penicillin-insensitive murein endopeptidase [Kribbella sp.]|uniref:penicillin-insensitive murein endopeptidase n=1 Tax=Kribbella sp. TaxID=1871183 RepID=UPI002D7941ED|nr:penicillin-insensitive murein endopeptidase [Kribbella sp.]HET6297682.1 penicillin-insensitive murein endopeptidase [Kribbella sp.]
MTSEAFLDEAEVWGEVSGTGTSDPLDNALPQSGPGFYCKSTGRQYGRRETLRAMTSIAAEWLRRHPSGPRIGVTDISLRGGGPMAPHKSHQRGTDVDIRPVRNDGKEEPITYTMPAYSRQLTQELVDLIRNNPVVQVSKVFFNDPQIKGVSPLSGHHDHMHVSFTTTPATGGTSYVPSAPGAAPSAPRAVTGGPPPAGPQSIRLGTIHATRPDGTRYTYQFTSDDLVWTARFIVGEAGGRDNADNRAVIWAMINLYGLIRHRQYPTFHGFLRAYSTPLQPSLRNWGAARRHMHKPEFVKTGQTYPPPAPPGIPVGQLRQFLKLQSTVWAALPQPARNLATSALTGAVPNPIGNATQFASTAVYFRDRHGRLPNDGQWLKFTQDYAKGQRWQWVGHRAGLNQRNNAFFVENRFSKLPAGAVRVQPPRP